MLEGSKHAQLTERFSKLTHQHISTLFVVLLLAIIITTSCYQRTYIPTRTRDFSVQSTPDRSKPIPRYVIHNQNDSVSRLYFAVKPTDLLFQRSNVNNELLANFKVEYIVHPVTSPKVITDSGYVVYSNIAQTTSEWIYGYADFDVPSGNGEYFVDVVLRDINKMNIAYDLLYLSHTGRDAANNFVLMEPTTSTPIYGNSVGNNQEFRIQYIDATITKMYVTYYKNTAEAARPPYALPVATLPVQGDSSWTIDISQNPILKLSDEGYYRFATAPLSDEGLLVCRFKDDYPKVTTPLALLEPLRYITTKKEYTTLETSKHMKVAIDSFWIATGGSQERARELISAYYGRVEIVNTHFSTYKEGWKTDRGMVYIIYGEPQNVYRSPERETWVYGTDNSGNTLNFVFNRNTTSGFPNDFELERNQVYNVSWITAVDYWKQGQVYRAR
jgi:GWxTD domain-containing protein